MPYFGQEFHDWRLERVFIGDADVDFEGAAFIWCARWAFERALQFSYTVADGVDDDVGDRVSLDICQFLAYSPSSVTGHLEFSGLLLTGLIWAAVRRVASGGGG